MDIEIINQRENPLLGRTELEIKITHDKGTPKFQEIRSKIAALKDLDNDKFVLQAISAIYGTSTSTAEVRIYSSNEKLSSVEPTHVLKKNGFIEEKGEEEDE
ncbi:MAG: 30S ribosomal protein S24e [Candidatus Methanofastidiosa archaeon]|nr:30S ribosomal protein S24e [Candidatus Methanofastidiosa archaeon]